MAQHVKKRIIVTGCVDDENLAALYSGALVFTCMPHYEGFGLPPLEAMPCRVPVITSNTSSLPEVVGDAGMMLATGGGVLVGAVRARPSRLIARPVKTGLKE